MATTESIIWDFLKGKKLNDFAIAGIMGNLYAESALSPINLQSTGNKKLQMTDEEYTAAVDNGTYTGFVKDSHGYGLAQWTYWSRKEKLYNYAKSKKKSIGDLVMQLEFLYEELATGYTTCFNKLKNAKSVLEASNAMLLDFEKPKNQGADVQKKRASYGQKYYDKFAKVSLAETNTSSIPAYEVGKTYTLQVEVNVRTAPGTSASKKTWTQLTAGGKSSDKNKNGALDKGAKVTCLAIQQIGKDIWMRIPSGWIAAYYDNKPYVR